MWTENYGSDRGLSTKESTVVAFCPIPDPLESEAEWRAYQHLDLTEMSRFELRLAGARVVMRLAHEKCPHPWLLERHKAIARRLRDEN